MTQEKNQTSELRERLDQAHRRLSEASEQARDRLRQEYKDAEKAMIDLEARLKKASVEGQYKADRAREDLNEKLSETSKKIRKLQDDLSSG